MASEIFTFDRQSAARIQAAERFVRKLQRGETSDPDEPPRLDDELKHGILSAACPPFTSGISAAAYTINESGIWLPSGDTFLTTEFIGYDLKVNTRVICGYAGFGYWSILAAGCDPE